MEAPLRATVFGLDVGAPRPLPFLERATAPPTGRPLELTLPEGGVGPIPDGARLIADERLPGGAVNFQVHEGEEGLRIGGPGYGTSVLAADGRALAGAPEADGLGAWQRLLVSQALPLAATLQGLEALHAAAVVRDGRAIALTGPSGVGKTSLARALVARGAEFLADDVLALEPVVGGPPLAHPGAPIAGVDRGAVASLRSAGGLGGGVLWGDGREQVEAVELAPAAAPLGALFFLERDEAGPAEPRFEPVDDPRLVLASTFVLLLEAPGRLGRLLDVAAAVARGRCERVLAGPAVGIEELATAIGERAAR